MPEPALAELERVAARAARTTRAPPGAGAALRWHVDAGERVVTVAAVLAGELVAAAVRDPRRGETFSAHLGGGARCDGAPIAVGACDALRDARVAAGAGFAALAPRVRELHAVDVVPLALCRLAAGRLDGCLARGAPPPDVLAATLVAEQAGARAELPCPENGSVLTVAAPGLFEALRAAAEG